MNSTPTIPNTSTSSKSILFPHLPSPQHTIKQTGLLDLHMQPQMSNYVSHSLTLLAPQYAHAVIISTHYLATTSLTLQNWGS